MVRIIPPIGTAAALRRHAKIPETARPWIVGVMPVGTVSSSIEFAYGFRIITVVYV
jgi:hypothetical protein